MEMNGNVAYLLHICPIFAEVGSTWRRFPMDPMASPRPRTKNDEVLIVDAREVWKAGEGCWRLLGFRKENHGMFDTILRYTTM